MKNDFDYSNEVTNNWDILEKEGFSEINKHPKFKKGDKGYLAVLYNIQNSDTETIESADFIEVLVLSEPMDEIGGWTYEISNNDTGITLTPQYNLHTSEVEAKEDIIKRLRKRVDIISKSIKHINSL
jgi:hypothetical protein